MCTILNCTFKDNFTKFGSNISKIESQKVTCVESKISKFEINSAISVLQNYKWLHDVEIWEENSTWNILILLNLLHSN